jgi:hypothetical protein
VQDLPRYGWMVNEYNDFLKRSHGIIIIMEKNGKRKKKEDEKRSEQKKRKKIISERVSLTFTCFHVLYVDPNPSCALFFLD